MGNSCSAPTALGVSLKAAVRFSPKQTNQEIQIWHTNRIKCYFKTISLYCPFYVASGSKFSEMEFLKSLWGLGTEEKEGYRTGPPGYIGWRNSYLGIDSWATYTFKNTGSGLSFKIHPMVITS